MSHYDCEFGISSTYTLVQDHYILMMNRSLYHYIRWK